MNSVTEITKPGSFTEDGVYAPKDKIAVALSFEGVFNDGAPECGLTTFNAYRMLDWNFDAFGRTVEPEKFDSIRNSDWMVAFLRMRPCVNKAWHYFKVIDVLRDHPEERARIISDPMDTGAFDVLLDDYHEKCNATDEIEKTLLDDAFYTERTRMSTVEKGDVVPGDMEKYEKWVAIQSPFPQSKIEVKKLRKTIIYERDGGAPEIVSGFVPFFATSKDNTSTELLCKTYVSTGQLEADDYDDAGGIKCTIPRQRIFGKDNEIAAIVREELDGYFESVKVKTGKYPDARDKVVQLVMIAHDAGVAHDRVWRVNDRYDAPEQVDLWLYGFNRQFLVPGYTFPHDYGRAEKDGRIFVRREMEGSAEFLGQKAKRFGH